MRTTRITRSTRAGLLFPMSRVKTQMKKKCSSKKMRIGWGASAYMTAVLEYMTGEMIELSGNSCRDNKRKRISPRDIMLAVRNDDELNTLLPNVVIPGAGIMPSILAIHRPPAAGCRVATIAKKSPRKQSLAKMDSNATKHTKAAQVRPPLRVSKAKRKATASGSSMGLTQLSDRTLLSGVKLTVAAGDIALVQCNAVVIPSSSDFSLGGQVASHINRVSGGRLQKELKAYPHRSIASGGAALVKCNQMRGCQFEAAIFCNGPSWGDAASAIALLEETTKNCLARAQKSGMKSIAFPAIGSGVGNFPKQTAVETILRAISGYLKSKEQILTDIVFVLHDQQSIDVYVTELGRLQE
uniref:Macro domain-containing protein n=1 Tax=Plectus sambesii TaxID=2011161 RepID=A0A914V496_9BILA